MRISQDKQTEVSYVNWNLLLYHVIVHKLGHDSYGNGTWTFTEYVTNGFVLQKQENNTINNVLKMKSVDECLYTDKSE